MPDSSLLPRLKERKLVQWALAYLAGAWVLFEVSDVVGGHLGWPSALYRGLLVLLAVGFLVALVLAWYHGEKGRQRVSGPELLMVAILLFIAGGVLSLLGPGEEAATPATSLPRPPIDPGRPGIAVLVCDNLTSDPDYAFLAASLHDEILLKLQRISSLFSIGRASVEFYRDHPTPLTDIARELGVGFVAECSVQKHEERIRVIFQLLDGETGGQLWADDYDRELTAGNLFDIQGDIAQQVAAAMRAVLNPEDQARIAERPTENTEAFSQYLRGRFFWNKKTEEGFLRAIEYFQQALEEDPSYALAYAGMADSYNSLGWQDLRPSEEVYPKAKAAAERALVIDETLAEAHASLAYVHMLYDWNWEAAGEAYRRALELNPDYAEAHQWYAEFLAYMGRHDESIAEAQRAKRLDPLSPGIGHNLGLMLYEARQFDLAIEEYQRVLDMDPGFAIAHNYLGLAYAGEGRYDAAVAEVSAAIGLSEVENPLFLGTLGFIHASMGSGGEAREVLEHLIELSNHRYVAPVSIAIILGALGQLDEAFGWMEEGFRVRDDYMMVLKVEPRLDSLRADPRFQELLRRMNLPE